MSFNPNPWVRGFQPPSKCRNCSRVGQLVFTGKRDRLGNHVYRCLKCGASIAAPTDYAKCTLFSDLERLEKDVFYNPCRDCLHRTPVEGSGVCLYFRKQATYGDLDGTLAQAIQDTIIRTKVHPKDERTLDKRFYPKKRR